MTQTIERPLALPVSKMADLRRAEILDGLNAALANMIDISTAAKEAHWNVRGPNFAGLHELFDTISAETREYADLMAERLVALGGKARGTIQDVVHGSNLSPFPSDEQQWEVLAAAMRGRLIATSERIRGYADGLGDEIATQDIYIEILRGIEKRAWMLDAHLAGYR
jgi:starvation-inducible DNA-binding protein